ncbi:hypothetical protein [Rhizobium leguminosarum]|uniref:hypothetical protein n=1 Tax=Rhizobium leguminosarum TaxID=384 RepID=UPI00103CE5FB|nr:hypothetical protein [Rhizobium leguminosarum]MBY5651778.1 hypothetical protein [Rhizobium leguminosarum]TBZ06266.1 hypothetical protein E0H38_33180 [Rhizobium leguminosarum bv. viciae]
MAGFWKSILTAKGRQAFKERIEYDASVQRRIGILSEFRSNAVQEIKTLYHDAVFLMSMSGDKFLAVSNISRIIVEGKFEDRLVPAMAYVDTSDPDANMKMALATQDFQRRIESYRRERGFVRLQRDIDKPTEKGYSYRVKNLNLAYAVKVTRNGEDVAKATFRTPKARVELTQKTYKEIVERLSPGVFVTVRIDVALFDDYMQSDCLWFELSYYDEVRNSLGHNKDFLLNICHSLIPFLTVMVNVLEQPPALGEDMEDADQSAEEIAEKRAEAWINPPPAPEPNYDWDSDGNFIGDPDDYEYMPENYQPEDYQKAPQGWKKTT